MPARVISIKRRYLRVNSPFKTRSGKPLRVKSREFRAVLKNMLRQRQEFKVLGETLYRRGWRNAYTIGMAQRAARIVRNNRNAEATILRRQRKRKIVGKTMQDALIRVHNTLQRARRRYGKPSS